MKVWACRWKTRHWDEGMSLHATERDAWASNEPFWEHADDAIVEELDRLLDADDLDEFREKFYAVLDSTGHEVTVEELDLPWTLVGSIGVVDADGRWDAQADRFDVGDGKTVLVVDTARLEPFDSVRNPAGREG